MASQELKQIVAREAAQGDSTAKLARRHKYSWKGMSLLLKTPEMKRLVAEEREALDDLAAQHRAELVLMGAPALKNIRAAVENPKHPKNLEMSRFVVEKILPSRTQLEGSLRVEPGLSAEAQEAMHAATTGIATTLSELKAHLEGGAGDFGRFLVRSGPEPEKLG